MKHAQATDPRDLVRHVRQAMKQTRFLVIASDASTSYLYGSTVSNADAMQRAQADHPFVTLTQEIEYLTPEALAALRASNPLPDAQIERLGRI